MAEWILEFPIVMLYTYCICHAVVSDFRKLRVPNWIPGALVIGFVPYAFLSCSELSLTMRLVIVATIFCIAFLFFYKGLLAGGDVKLLSAVSLWITPADILVFITLMSLIGAALAVTLMLVRRLNGDGSFAGVKIPQSVARWSRRGVVPYGTAIGLAGLVMLPQVFG